MAFKLIMNNKIFTSYHVLCVVLLQLHDTLAALEPTAPPDESRGNAPVYHHHEARASKTTEEDKTAKATAWLEQRVSKGGMKNGAALAIGIVVAVLVLGVVIAVVMWRKRKNKAMFANNSSSGPQMSQSQFAQPSQDYYQEPHGGRYQ